MREIRNIDTIRLGDLSTDVKDERCTSVCGRSHLRDPNSFSPQHALCPITNLRADICT